MNGHLAPAICHAQNLRFLKVHYLAIEEHRRKPNKNFSPVIRRIDMFNLQECAVAEITLDKKRCFLTCLYRWLSQKDDGLVAFCSDLTFLLNRFQPSCQPSIMLDGIPSKVK